MRLTPTRLRFLFYPDHQPISDVVVVAGLSFAFYEILTRALVVLVQEADIEITEEERQELEEEAAEPIFIPFPGFTKTVEPVPYRSTDPEWRAYVKVSRNQALLSSIRGQYIQGFTHTRIRVTNHQSSRPRRDGASCHHQRSSTDKLLR